MANESPATDDKAGALILSLQNRINDMETKLQKFEGSLAGKVGVEAKFLEDKIAGLRAEITELLKKKADVVEAVAVAKAQGVEVKAKSFLDELEDLLKW